MTPEGPRTGESLPGEAEAKKVADSLKETGAQLGEVNPSTITPEQFKVLEAKVEVIFAIMVAYAGVQMTEFGYGILSGGNPYVQDIIEKIGRGLGGLAGIGVGIMVIGTAWYAFAEGLKKLGKNLPKPVESKSSLPNTNEAPQNIDKV